jgi:starvation-inducible DNA-binding protein
MATTKTKSPPFATKNDLGPEVRQQMIDLLNQQLADTFDLYSQTKQAHWNVKGTNFYQLHLLFDSLAGGVLEFVDTIAERATSLGGVALGTVRMAADNSSLKEYPLDAVDGRPHVEAVAARFAAVANSTRAAIEKADEAGDATTADLFTQLSRELDKNLWFIESHLQG